MVLPRLLAGALAAAAAMAHAQSSTPPASSAPATKLQYPSAFSDYRPYVEVEVLSWTKANGEAALLGGHMGQMKHDAMPTMQGPKSNPSMPKAPPTGISPTLAPAAPGHAGHAR